MRRKKHSALRYVIVFLAICAADIGVTLFEVARNPWLKQIAHQETWRWYSLMVSGHAGALLFIQRSPWFVVTMLFVALVLTALLWWHDNANG